MEELWVLKQCCANPNGSGVWHLGWKQCGLWEKAKKFTQASNDLGGKEKKKAECCQANDSSFSTTWKQLLFVSPLLPLHIPHVVCIYAEITAIPTIRYTVRVSVIVLDDTSSFVTLEQISCNASQRAVGKRKCTARM